VDLQGDDQRDKIVLTDIEFSDTMDKFNMSSETLLKMFRYSIRQHEPKQSRFPPRLPPPRPHEDSVLFGVLALGTVALIGLAFVGAGRRL
jgi:hypothetical protein